MNYISNIKEISKNYDYFIFDIWGVVHDGSSAYSGAVEAIKFLRSEDKKICFLSNAPRRAYKIAKVLNDFGITSDLYDFIMSSGESAYIDLKQNQISGFKHYQKNYLYIGPEKDIDLLEGLEYNFVQSAKDADFAITTGFNKDNSTIEEKLPQILDAKNYNLDLICVNPDMIVVKKTGEEMLCAGVIAKYYKQIGGKVIYYGKPYKSAYEISCKLFGENIDKTKLLAIGDGLETDISGANNFGIDSLLLTGGILSNLINNNLPEKEFTVELIKICSKYNSFPKFFTKFL